MKKIVLFIVMVAMLAACNKNKKTEKAKEEQPPVFTQEQKDEIRMIAQETVDASINPLQEEMSSNFDSVFKILNKEPADQPKEETKSVADTVKKATDTKKAQANNYMSKKQVDALLAKTQKNSKKEFDEILRRLAAVESDVREMKPKVDGLVQWYNTMDHPTQPPPNDYKQ